MIPSKFFTLHRTLRVPDSAGKSYSLPPSLGHFPLVACKDTAAPLEWANDYMFPMYQSEAMWVSFTSRYGTPHACVMTASAINVLTGEVITDIDAIELKADPQNYMAIPPQPWIDGIKHADGKVGQFVCVSFESGKSLGQQVAGIKDDTIKLVFYPTKFPEKHEQSRGFGEDGEVAECLSFDMAAADDDAPMKVRALSMGIGRGGEIKQKIYPDPNGIDEWNREAPVKFQIRIVNALMWEALTGSKPPYEPPNANDYRYHDYPWFDLYNEPASDLNPSEVLAAVKSAFDGQEPAVNTRPAVQIPLTKTAVAQPPVVAEVETLE